MNAKTWVRAIRFINGGLFLIIAGSLGLLMLFSLNCTAPIAPGYDVSLKYSDSMAVLAILKANRLTWQKTSFVARNSEGRATSLLLSNLHMDTLPPAIGDLDGLVILNVAGNLLNSLPEEMASLTNLRELYARDNRLARLPDGLRLAALQIIDLNGNRIRELPVNIDVTHLTELDLDSNQISTLPPDFKYLNALERFSIAANQLDSLPESISFLTRLGRMNVSSNRLKALPASMLGMGFTFLNVGNNQLCFPDSSRDSLTIRTRDWLDTASRGWKSTQRCN